MQTEKTESAGAPERKPARKCSPDEMMPRIAAALGWTGVHKTRGSTGYYWYGHEGDSQLRAFPFWPYDLMDAWRLVPVLHEKGFRLVVYSQGPNPNGSFATVRKDVDPAWLTTVNSEDDTPAALALTICRAALEVLEGESE